ncbi:hypothetical protein CONPUDRAFT_139028 [Coniophora puteana RWD-64-598 SS2]|uniref:SMODS and SLOG-associating 2TM effector domain-containing protein n=1 Tax=Coniophora puteana (strain RWD-64-598) TaxID=741705 RepID=A0A5M3MG38_CONPW|nr:uncharacterized protein CONPUDRAFT_139028 [Coniophora puteana RWD-64-598 SS2]EIW77890.1 hypothetical protein CONPUDRAFT_139028 [Coniophora puteana RWD-64-598 SS2]
MAHNGENRELPPLPPLDDSDHASPTLTVVPPQQHVSQDAVQPPQAQLPESHQRQRRISISQPPAQGSLGSDVQVLTPPVLSSPEQRHSQIEHRHSTFSTSTGNRADLSSQTHSSSTPPPHPRVGTPAIWARGGSASPIPSIPEQNQRDATGRLQVSATSLDRRPADTTRPPLTASPTQYDHPDVNDASAAAAASYDPVPLPRPRLRARTTTNGHISIMSGPPAATREREHSMTNGGLGPSFSPNGPSRRVSMHGGAPQAVRRGSGHSFNGTRDGYGHPYNIERRNTGVSIELPPAAVREDYEEDDLGHIPHSRRFSAVSGKAKRYASRARDSVISREDRAALMAAQDKRIQLLLIAALAEKRKCELKAKLTAYALNFAIGLQVLLGALTTALSVATTGRQTSIMTATLGGISTLVASYLARARGSGEPEVSVERVRDLEQFVRECTALDLDAHRPGGDPMLINVRINDLRLRFEEMLGNATADRRASSNSNPTSPQPQSHQHPGSSTQTESVVSQQYASSAHHPPPGPQSHPSVAQHQTLAPQNYNTAPQHAASVPQQYPSAPQNHTTIPQDHTQHGGHT